jgi:hypothetical protein
VLRLADLHAMALDEADEEDRRSAKLPEDMGADERSRWPGKSPLRRCASPT